MVTDQNGGRSPGEDLTRWLEKAAPEPELDVGSWVLKLANTAVEYFVDRHAPRTKRPVICLSPQRYVEVCIYATHVSQHHVFSAVDYSIDSRLFIVAWDGTRVEIDMSTSLRDKAHTFEWRDK